MLEAQVQSTTVQPFYHLSCMNKNVNFRLVNKYIDIGKFRLIINYLLEIFVVVSNKHKFLESSIGQSTSFEPKKLFIKIIKVLLQFCPVISEAALMY